MPKRFKIGRSAVTGRFTSVKKARQYPTTHIVQLIKRKKGKHDN